MNESHAVLDASKQVSNPVWLVYLAVFLPLISALAAHFMSHEALLLVYLLAGLSVFAACLKSRSTDSYFPLLVGAIALSLFLPETLMSPYVTGSDSHQEFALLMQVAQQGAWQTQIGLTFNSVLSVTVLPSIVSTVTSLDGILVFKIVYPILFSMVPVILYQIYRRIMAPQAAFLSVFVFLIWPATYVELLQLERQMIAELIMVLLLWLQLSPTFRKASARSFLVVLLTVGLVMSHYSTAIIYVFVISLAYVVSRIPALRSRGVEPLGNLNVIFISVVLFVAWFLFVASGSVLRNLSDVFVGTFGGLFNDFLNPASRPSVVVDALGLVGMRPGILHIISRGTQYLVAFCMLAGCVLFIVKHKKTRAENIFMPPMLASMVLLLASVGLPFLAAYLNFARIYQIALLLVSPCFYFGAVKITEFIQWLCAFGATHPIRIRMGRSVAAAILFSYLLFTSGWLWSVTSDVPTSSVLDQVRMVNSPNFNWADGYYSWYTPAQDVAAARWISSYGDAARPICSDWTSRFKVLNSYGGYPRQDGPYLGGTYPQCSFAFSYSFVNVENSILGVGVAPASFTLGSYSLNNTTPILLSENRVYSDGAAIYEGF